MAERKKAIITVPQSPYRILDVPFDADKKTINQAMRRHMVRNRRHAAEGNKAQKRLTDTTQRVEEDALCYPVEQPELDVSHLGERLEFAIREIPRRFLDHLIVLSDIHFPENIEPYDQPDLNLGEIPFREALVKRPDRNNA